jgi:hypothetical protein
MIRAEAGHESATSSKAKMSDFISSVAELPNETKISYGHWD